MTPSPPLKTIGKLASATGVKIPTIRYYEQIGLLAPPPRTASDRRLYDAAALRRLTFIRHARDLGFGLETVRSLLDLSDQPDRPCVEVNLIAEHHLAQITAKTAQLRALEAELTRMTAECAGGRVSTCKVIEALSDPGPSSSHRDQLEPF